MGGWGSPARPQGDSNTVIKLGVGAEQFISHARHDIPSKAVKIIHSLLRLKGMSAVISFVDGLAPPRAILPAIGA